MITLEAPLATVIAVCVLAVIGLWHASEPLGKMLEPIIRKAFIRHTVRRLRRKGHDAAAESIERIFGGGDA